MIMLFIITSISFVFVLSFHTLDFLKFEKRNKLITKHRYISFALVQISSYKLKISIYIYRMANQQPAQTGYYRWWETLQRQLLTVQINLMAAKRLQPIIWVMILMQYMLLLLNNKLLLNICKSRLYWRLTVEIILIFCLNQFSGQ